MNKKILPFVIETQPDDFTCGATTIHAIMRYHDVDIPLPTIISEIGKSFTGGTLATMLGSYALTHGLCATIYTHNLKLFDPSWFNSDKPINLIEKLTQQKKYKKGRQFDIATETSINFLKSGGQTCFETINFDFFVRHINANLPLLVGLSATYLYDCAREVDKPNGIVIFDDIRGLATGHFVVVHGYDLKENTLMIADPYRQNPYFEDNYYAVDSQRFINALMLGVVTYDGNILVITPK